MTHPAIISNSEVLEYQKCKRSHYYHHVLGIEPQVLPTKLERGVVGHKALEIIWKSKDDGATEYEAVELASRVIADASLAFIQSSPNASDMSNRVKMYTDLIPIIKEYTSKYWNTDSIETVALEETYIIPISSEVSLGCKVDRLGIYKSWPFRGDYVIIDWKFRFNFLSDALLDLNGQLPKYMWAVAKAIDKPVTKGFMDIIRYRQLNDETTKFARPLLKNNSTVRNRVINNHAAVAQEIIEVKKLSVKEYGAVAQRNMTEWACKDCVFIKVCTLELYDRDPTTELRDNFKPSEYGYEDVEEMIIF